MASATTVNEVQAIKTLNNLNMEGKFVESSLRQFTNLNTAAIIYGDSIQDAASGSTVTLYDAITEQNIDFKLRTNPTSIANEYQKQSTADATALELVVTINKCSVPNNNEYSAIIEYFADLNNATANNDTITLYNYETAVVFTMVTNTPETPSAIAVQFEKVNSDVDATATNLATAINNHSAFSAILDITKQIIIITQTSSSGKPTDNPTPSGFTSTELSVTNFSNFSATIDPTNKTITVIQNSSKSYNSNPTPFLFTPEELNVTNFKVNSGDEAAISSETIGTYQILNKVITDLSTLKKKITDRNKILQKDLSNDVDDVDHVTLSSSDKTATHQSNITADKSRGNLNETNGSNGSNHEKPSVFTATDSSTIFYSEDALFTLLKGLGYEIFKFKNGITGSNNGVGSAYAGLSEIPISISPQTPHTSGIATLPNIAATIHNINRSGTINTTENTSAGSIPEGTSNTDDGVGLIQLINTIINNITLIKKSIKTRELLILETLKTSNFSNPTIDVANYHSKVPTLKTRGDLLDDTGGTDETTHNFHKPSIFNSSESYRYSEDAVFGLFSCISYELMKLLNFTNASNNGGHIEHAGLASIPISIELIN